MRKLNGSAIVVMVALSLAAAPASRPAGEVEPSSTFTSRAKEVRADHPLLRSGRDGPSPKAKLKKMIADAEKIDAAIAACGATSEIRAALYENRLRPGMTLDQVRIVSPEGFWSNKVETATTLQFDCPTRTPFGSIAAIYRVASNGGTVVAVADR